jgi:hypothetical protein
LSTGAFHRSGKILYSRPRRATPTLTPRTPTRATPRTFDLTARDSDFEDESDVEEEMKNDTLALVLIGIKYMVAKLPKELGKSKKDLLSMVSLAVTKARQEREEGEVVQTQLEQKLMMKYERRGNTIKTCILPTKE